jgi:WD40 repeat protein
LDGVITTDEKDKTEVVNTQKKPEVTITKETPPDSFEVFFPNDVYDVDRYPRYEDGRCDNSLLTLKHKKDVYYTEFSPDGTKVVTTSYDYTARIWDVATGNLLKTLVGHTSVVLVANFSSDGTKVVTASIDKTAKIWDVATGNLLFDLVGHTGTVNRAYFSSDGTKVVTASYDKTAKIWDVATGNLLNTLVGHTNAVRNVQFNPDGTKVVTASWDHTAKIWDVATGNLLNTLVGHTEPVRNAQFNPDGTKVVTASWDHTAKIWDVATGNLLNTLVGHKDHVYYVEFNPDGTKVVTTSDDKTAKIWDIDEPECLINYKENADGTGFGIGDYYEMCYEYPVNGKKKWSSEKCSDSKGPEGVDGRVEPDRTDFGLNAAGGSPNATFFKPVTLDGKTYKSWRDPEYHKDLELYLKNKCKTCKVKVVGFASNVGTNAKNRNDKLSTLRAENVKEWLETNVFKTPPISDRIVIASSGEGISTARGKCPESPKSRIKNYKDSLNDVIACKANRYVKVEFVIDETLIPKNETGTEKESKNDEPIKTPAISTSRFYTECDYFEKLEESSPVVYNSIKEQIKYFQPAFHSTTPEGFNARLTFLQQCMRQGPTDGAGSNNNPNNLAFGRPPVCILRIGDFYHTKIVIENLSFSFEPLVWDLNPEGIGVQPMICNVDMSFAFIGGSSLNGPINRLQNAVSFNYYANNEIYDNRPDTIKINGNTTEIVDGEKDITGEKNKAPLAQDTAGLTNKEEPVKDQVKEEVVANSGTENSQPLTDENNQPVETPVEKVKKYPGFDETTGIYTTQFTQILTANMASENKKFWSDKIVIPKGTKFYLGSKTKNFSVNAIIGDKGINPNKYKLESLIKDTLPNVSPIPSVGKTITKKISLADKIYYNRVFLDCDGIGILVESSLGAKEGEPLKTKDGYNNAYYNNAPLEKVLTDIFCKAGKVKTLKEIKQFDNTK